MCLFGQFSISNKIAADLPKSQSTIFPGNFSAAPHTLNRRKTNVAVNPFPVHWRFVCNKRQPRFVPYLFGRKSDICRFVFCWRQDLICSKCWCFGFLEMITMVSVILIVDNYGNFNGISFVYSVRGFLVMITMVSVMLVVMIKMTESLWTGRREYVRNLSINTWLLITFTFSLSAHQFPLSTCLPITFLIRSYFHFLKPFPPLSLFPPGSHFSFMSDWPMGRLSVSITFTFYLSAHHLSFTSFIEHKAGISSISSKND